MLHPLLYEIVFVLKNKRMCPISHFYTIRKQNQSGMLHILEYIVLLLYFSFYIKRALCRQIYCQGGSTMVIKRRLSFGMAAHGKKKEIVY